MAYWFFSSILKVFCGNNEEKIKKTSNTTCFYIKYFFMFVLNCLVTEFMQTKMASLNNSS